MMLVQCLQKESFNEKPRIFNVLAVYTRVAMGTSFMIFGAVVNLPLPLWYIPAVGVSVYELGNLLRVKHRRTAAKDYLAEQREKCYYLTSLLYNREQIRPGIMPALERGDCIWKRRSSTK